MPLANVTRFSLEILYQNYRAPGVLPGSVPPGRGDAAATQDPSFKVADEFIRAIPFVRAETGNRPVARQYQVRSALDVFEPPFTARPAGTPWQPGTTTPFGQELELIGARFKKISTVVRSDELMVAESHRDVLAAQIRLARVGIVRSLSEAILHSVPASDDDAELAGLPFFLASGGPQDVAWSPARRMMGGLAEIEARCCPSGGDFGSRPDAFVMSSRARWRLLKELEDKGVDAAFRPSRLTGRVQPHFHGVPVLIGRVPEPAGATATTEAWAVKLRGPSAVRVVHVGGNPRHFGLRAEPVTTLGSLDGSGEAKSATRATEIFGVYSVLVPEVNAIARLRGIPAPDPFTAP